MNNIAPTIEAKRKIKLYNYPKHPEYMFKKHTQDFFYGYVIFDDLSKVVSLKDSYDDLLIPQDHHGIVDI